MSSSQDTAPAALPAGSPPTDSDRQAQLATFEEWASVVNAAKADYATIENAAVMPDRGPKKGMLPSVVRTARALVVVATKAVTGWIERCKTGTMSPDAFESAQTEWKVYAADMERVNEMVAAGPISHDSPVRFGPAGGATGPIRSLVLLPPAPAPAPAPTANAAQLAVLEPYKAVIERAKSNLAFLSAPRTLLFCPVPDMGPTVETAKLNLEEDEAKVDRWIGQARAGTMETEDFWLAQNEWATMANELEKIEKLAGHVKEMMGMLRWTMTDLCVSDVEVNVQSGDDRESTRPGALSGGEPNE